ncbi:MAG: ISAs1 family transposase [Treponema sp.]|jgi:predicted transposase YbfD/YdcC|nr:ISAs1 family transposase [Treponema sp.]
MTTVIEVRGTRTRGNETTVSTRYFISNKDAPTEVLGKDTRGHWGIENGLHWMLDVNIREDGCRARKDNSPKNLNIVRKITLSRLRAVDGGRRVSVKRKMRRLGLVPDFLFKVLFGE